MNESDSSIHVSAVIPVGSRHADLTELYREYREGLDGLGLAYEIIFVLDGQRLEAATALRALQAQGEHISVVSLTRTFGEATALMAGFELAKGRIILTLPAYYQIDGQEIRKLIAALDSADMAVGRRWPRAGGRIETWRRSAFHGLISTFTGSRFRDLGCGARAMKSGVVREIALYGDQHRFLALLAHRQGFRVVEVDVRQSPKDIRPGRYRLKEYAHRMLDILTVLFLVRFTKKPLRFFGMLGLMTFILGALVIVYLVIDRMFFGQALGDRPILLLASLLAVLGLQLFAIGLLGELIIFTHAREIKEYQVAEVVEFPAAPEMRPQERQRHA